MYGQYPPRKAHMGTGQIVLIVIVLIFAGYMIFTTLNPSTQQYTTIESGSIGQNYSGDALIVRKEAPYDAEGVTSIDYLASEGSLVDSGTIICYVYSSGYNQKEMLKLQNYREQIKLKHLSLLAQETAYDQEMIRLESSVLERAKEIRRLVQGETGNLSNQENMLDGAMSSRQNYLRRKYADDQSLTRLYDDEDAQVKRIESWTKPYPASSAGIVSFYSDGYEYGLNSDNFDSFTPQQVRAMIGGAVPEKSTIQKGRTTIYRLIRQNIWNVLLLIKNNPAWTPVDGQSYQLHLSGFDDTVVDAKVVSSTRSGGELLVRLEVRSDVKPVLYMRTCEAELGENVNSLVVNRNAIFEYQGMQGVAVVNGSDKPLFVPIRIVQQDGNRAFIESIQPGLLFVGQTVMLF